VLPSADIGALRRIVDWRVVWDHGQRYGNHRSRVQNGDSGLDCGYGTALAMGGGVVDRGVPGEIGRGAARFRRQT
jgi:hypothetical protein